MPLKETLKEMSRLKSNCSANSSIFALLTVHYYGYTCAPNPCMEPLESEHAMSEIPKPQSYRGEYRIN